MLFNNSLPSGFCFCFCLATLNKMGYLVSIARKLEPRNLSLELLIPTSFTSLLGNEFICIMNLL